MSLSRAWVRMVTHGNYSMKKKKFKENSVEAFKLSIILNSIKFPNTNLHINVKCNDDL